MAVSKAQQAAVNKYIKNNYDRLNITISKGAKQLIETVAKAGNESINGYVKKAIQAQIKSDTGQEVEL